MVQNVGRQLARTRRDRHERGMRGPLAPSGLPTQPSRADIFDDMVLSAVERLEQWLPEEIDSIEFQVADVPPPEDLLTAWETRCVPLAGSRAGEVPHIVFYRRPIELRTETDEEIVVLVHQVLAEQVAEVLGVFPEDIDPEYPT